MPQAEPIWELVKEADDMVAKLCEMYPEKFGHIDATMIGCAAISGKEKPESQRWDGKISGIKPPASLWSKKVYCIHFFKTTWDQYDETHRAAMLFRLLTQVSEECDGKVLPEDLKDSYCLVKAFGCDYMKSPGLPNLVSAKQVFGDNNRTTDNGV